MTRPPRLPRFLSGLFSLTLAAQAAADDTASSQPASQTAAPRPRVLLCIDDLARLQARCGVRPITGSTEPFASHASDFQRIKKWADANIDLPLEDGALYLPAFMHVVTGTPGRPDAYSRCVERALAANRTAVVDFDDAVAALDWCWDALDAATRQAYARKLLDAAEPLAPTDGPLEHFIFHPKLCHVAAAIALQNVWLPASIEQRKVQRILDSAETYFEKTLPRILSQLHGRAPVPALQADFEADLVFAVELWNTHTQGRYWPKIAPLIERLLDGYFWSQSDWPSFNSALVHDYGISAPEIPGTGLNALARGACDILARRAKNPLAGWYAALARDASAADDPRELNRRWLHILHDDPARPRVDRLEAPLARNLENGWLLMRSDWRPGATVVAFDAGQPFWLNRQHFDAGQFQIIRKGRLALDSGDDVSAEAVPARGGAQGLGPSAGRFDDYAVSTVAHNCVLIADPRVRLQRAGRDWPAPGNQRLFDGDFKPTDEPIEKTDRLTGRLIAFETNPHYSYAAADIARAYPAKAALLFDRHLLFVAGRYLFVIDRIVAERPDSRVTWLLHLPSRPRIGRRDLDSQFRRRGVNNAAGTWVYPPGDDWFQADGGEGRLLVRSLAPLQRRVTFVGGPQTVTPIADGRWRGRAYVGSNEKGFEYYIAPASSIIGLNAWYKLGTPDDIGSTFGVGAGWGRMEVEATDKSAETIFIHLLVPQDRTAEPPAIATPKYENGILTVTLPAGDLQYEITLSPRGAEPGRVRALRGDKTEFDQPLTTRVHPNLPAPTR